MGRESSSSTTALASLACGIVGIVGGIGCATPPISDFSAYEEIPMKRVVPYPSQQELRDRGVEVVIVDRSVAGVDENVLVTARTQARRVLQAIATESGAALVGESLADLDELRLEDEAEVEGGTEAPANEGHRRSGAEVALELRFSKLRYDASWKPPFRFPWQSDAEIAEKPGTCTHRAEVGVEVRLIELVDGAGSDPRTFALAHSSEQQTRDVDRACPLTPVRRGLLFETAIEEAMGCLRVPLGTRLRPRGHVIGHRKAPEAGRHVYRVSLGSRHGIDPEDRVEIRRELHAQSPSGLRTRSEQVIATGVVANRVLQDEAWVAIDPAQLSIEILEGDVARPVLQEGLLSSLSGPDCSGLLEER